MFGFDTVLECSLMEEFLSEAHTITNKSSMVIR